MQPHFSTLMKVHRGTMQSMAPVHIPSCRVGFPCLFLFFLLATFSPNIERQAICQVSAAPPAPLNTLELNSPPMQIRCSGLCIYDLSPEPTRVPLHESVPPKAMFSPWDPAKIC
ncbi:hypothetical protein K474DRAFT_1452712 [Panus rudis PR-1116 ss-1]|nr:hypothetical protein K474DRAFT_1452712 [Panus rudis PR-1116 ss-1]